MSENEDKYHDTVLDLEAKLKNNVDLILKLGNSLQGMFMFQPKPLSVYDLQLKHGLRYLNLYTLKQAISQCPKLYLASSLGNSDISLNIRDTEDTLDDASKSQQKVYEKMNDPIAVANKHNSPSILASMPNETPLIIELDKIKFCFQKLSELIQKNYKRASIFYTSPEEIQLNDFCQDQLKPIVNELQFYFEFFKTLFQRDVKEMKDVFESTESELCELEKQNDFLKDQLLEVSLKHEVELSVLLNHECVDNSLHAEIEQLKKKSIEIQEGLQARIKILEKDVQRCEKQNENLSLDFTVQALIKERDNVKLEYQKLFNSIKKTRSQTQTEIDELIAHVSKKTHAYGAIRAENQNLLLTIYELKTRLANVEKCKFVNTKFDKTNGSQPLLCVTPLHKHVIQKKTDVQKLEENHVVSKPVTLQTSPAKQRGVNSNKNVIAPGMYKVVTTHESQTNEAKHDLSSTGMNAASSVRRPMNRDSHVKNSVLANSKKPAKKVAVYVRKNKQTDNTSENVISNKENVIDVDVVNASKAKTSLCVSFHKTRFSKESTLSKSLDTTYVVSKPKIDVGSTSKANDKVVQIVLWIVDSGCSKHMTGDRSLLKFFIEKFMGTVRFGNDNFAAIIYYGDYIQGNITIFHVYYVEEGDDLLTGGRESNLYSISISDMAASSPVCLMSKATSTKSWLWHRRLSHLNFGTINDLTRLDLVDGLPKFKYGKDHLCSAYERGKSKKSSHPLKLVPSDHSKLEFLHMDLCGPMRVDSINGKKYILVIVDDYSRYTWVYFIHSKDETPEIIKKFIAQAQLNYKAKVCKIRTDNAACTMLIFSRLPEFLRAEVVATACFTQNRSLIHTRHNKTPYELLRSRKSNVEYFHVFGSLCYPTNDRDDLGKMKPKVDIGVFIGYSKTSRGFRIYNRHTKKIMETIHVKFDELTAMASEHDCLEPELQRFINHNSLAETINTPSKEDFDNLFGPMYEEYFKKNFSDTRINSAAQLTQIHEDSPSTSLIIVEEHEAPPIVTTSDEQTSPISLTKANEFNQEDSTDFDGNSQFVPYNPPSHEEIESSTTALEPSNVHNFHQVQPSTHIWIRDHPLDQVIGDLSKPIMTRQRLHADYEVCMYALIVNTIEPKNIKEDMADHSWIESMQDELNQFKRLQVWELVSRPEVKNIIALKWF
ncbi:retrovirus-related pol polyprotein from transposon TNT 1-94 [Tanacetum coccineum]